jgi:hypothetical protein
MSTIPASSIVSIIPGVVSAGGSALVLNGLVLTKNTRVPIGTVQSFADLLSVSSFFGPTSDERNFAAVYFNGFINSTKLPGSILFTQYPETAVAAYLRGGNAGALGLDAIKAMSGSLTVTVDGYPHTTASVSLSAATSFSAAAALIDAALDDPTECSFTATISGTTMTVSAVASGTLAVGQTISGVDVTVGSIITALGTGTGLTGTYTLSASSTVGTGEAMLAKATSPVVSYDSVSGAFVVTSGITGVASLAAFATGTLAAPLLLTSATGAVLSQGAAATTPGAFMDSIIQITQNWAAFTTIFNPDVSGNTNKLAFAAWNNDQNKRYAYVCLDLDQSPVAATPAASSLGYLIGTSGNNYSGTCVISSPSDMLHHAFVLGFTASIDFDAREGRATLAFKSQEGLTAGISTLQSAENLIANGYNFYGAYATANQDFLFMYPGSISGEFLWYDSYINQIWLNNQLQLALMELLTYLKSIPYNAAGYAMLEAACMDPINQAIRFGAIRAGVTLSQAQIAEINNAAGKSINEVLSQRGWYLLIEDATPQVRAARQSPPMTLWYLDGQSIQKIEMSSLNVQ